MRSCLRFPLRNAVRDQHRHIVYGLRMKVAHENGGGTPLRACTRLPARIKAPHPFSTLPPFSTHCFSVIDRQPWPLQAFCPLHPFLADEHSLLPLQELT